MALYCRWPLGRITKIYTVKYSNFTLTVAYIQFLTLYLYKIPFLPKTRRSYARYKPRLLVGVQWTSNSFHVGSTPYPLHFIKQSKYISIKVYFLLQLLTSNCILLKKFLYVSEKKIVLQCAQIKNIQKYNWYSSL